MIGDKYTFRGDGKLMAINDVPVEDLTAQDPHNQDEKTIAEQSKWTKNAIPAVPAPKTNYYRVTWNRASATEMISYFTAKLNETPWWRFAKRMSLKGKIKFWEERALTDSHTLTERED